MRVSWTVLIAGLSIALADPSPARAANTLSPAEATCRTLPGLNVLFRFGTGSAPTGPAAIGARGELYVGTREGYVHALHADGSYLWSYTLRGPVTGRPAFGAGGAVLVPTPRHIYALRPDGRLLWLFNSPVEIRSGLVPDPAGRLHFASADGRVFALSGRGALVGHVPGRKRVSAAPRVLSDGAIAVGREDGSVVVSRQGRIARFHLEAPPVALLGCPGARLCAVAGGALHALEGSSSSVRTPAVRAVSDGELVSVLSSDDRLRVFSGPTWRRLAETPLPAAASATPALDATGTTYVPLRNGALIAVGKDGQVSGCAAVARSPLGSPVVDAERKRILVTASEGVLAAIELF